MVPTCWNNRKTACRRRVGNSRAAFTLVEMLVSVALVVLMMSLFAQIFQLAVGSITRQKGMAENDQRSRTLSIVVRNDLKNRTFRILQPFSQESTNKATGDLLRDQMRLPDRKGYFYISENKLTVQTDDVLQFTVKVDDDDLPLFGKAQPLGDPTVDRNQPMFDDGQFNWSQPPLPWMPGDPLPANTPADMGSSRFAEISYFVRNGNLYRRVLLIREPFDPSWSTEPQDSSNNPLIPGVSLPPLPPPAPNPNFPFEEFWNKFDYSAYYLKISGFEGPRFHDRGSLKNKIGTGFFPLAHPKNRFGHDHLKHHPREYDSSGVFIGRFTHQETSDPMFGFPGKIPNFDGTSTPPTPPDPPFSSGTKMTLKNGVVNYNDGTTDVPFNGLRRGEDILLSNVHEFDIKVWDDAISTFVDIGHGGDPAGDYHQNKNLHVAAGLLYGPNATAAENRIFDTWHTQLDIEPLSTTVPPTYDPPPFRPARVGADGAPGVAGIDDDGDGNFDYLDKAKTILDPKELGFAGSDDVRIPLKAIQITIRFFDVSSNQMRQLTIVQALTN